MKLVLFLMAAIVAAQKPAPDFNAIKSEPKLDRRYWQALEYASSQIDAARKSYQSGSGEAYRTALSQVVLAVELSNDTLRATGRNPSKSPKHFKRAELKMRELIRRLLGLEDEVSVDDRDVVTRSRARIQEIHDELLLDIMGRRKD